MEEKKIKLMAVYVSQNQKEEIKRYLGSSPFSTWVLSKIKEEMKKDNFDIKYL